MIKFLILIIWWVEIVKFLKKILIVNENIMLNRGIYICRFIVNDNWYKLLSYFFMNL